MVYLGFLDQFWWFEVSLFIIVNKSLYSRYLQCSNYLQPCNILVLDVSSLCHPLILKEKGLSRWVHQHLEAGNRTSMFETTILMLKFFWLMIRSGLVKGKNTWFPSFLTTEDVWPWQGYSPPSLSAPLHFMLLHSLHLFPPGRPEMFEAFPFFFCPLFLFLCWGPWMWSF